MKKIGKMFLILSILLIGIIITVPLVIVISNDNIAKSVEKEIKETPLPENTKLVDSKSIADKLTGNGNGMQYFGAILIKTELSEEELNEYYEQYRKDEWSYIIEKQDSNRISVFDSGTYSFENIDNAEIDKYYMVYSWGSSNNNGFLDLDLRGH
jgi:hypothetical protein